MARLLILLAAVAVIYLLYTRAQNLPPHKRRSESIKLGLIVLVIAAVVLAATGRMHWVGAALTGLLVTLRQSLPLLIRIFPFLASLRGQKAAAGGQTSTVETAILRMQLDHDSGALQGEVLQGRYTDWRLQDMNREQLEELMAYCRSQDNDSAQLLDSYLQQRFPGEGPFGEGQTSGNSSTNGSDAAAMARREALAVLGLEEGATEEEIVAAHRTLIQKVHPDRGGNDYLAAKINQAKDLLLS